MFVKNLSITLPSLQFFQLLPQPVVPLKSSPLRRGWVRLQIQSGDLGGSLDNYVSVIEYSSNTASYGHGYILDLVQVGVGNFPVNKMNKINIKNALVGYYIDIIKPA